MPKLILDKIPFLKKHICATCNYVHKHRKKYLFASFVLAIVSVGFSILITSINLGTTFAGAGDLNVVMTTQEAPANVDIAVNEDIMVVFNQNLDGVGASGITGKIQVVPAGGDPVAGAVSFNDDMMPPSRVYIFNPTADLDPGTVYTVTITGGAAGVTANSGVDYLTTDYTWSFTTIVTDVTGPTVSSGTVNDLVAAPLTLTTVSPFVDQVATAPSLQINFNEHITGSTITADVVPSDGVPDNAYLSYVNSPNTVVKVAGTWTKFNAGVYDYMTFAPTAGLKQNTEYTLTLTTAITDDAPALNPMAANYVAKFLTTGDYSDSIPTITSQYPADLEGGIAIPAASIDVDFDQPINPATVDGSIAVYESDGTPVPGTTEIDPTDGSIIHFTPTSVNWLADESYSVALSGGDSGINNVRNVNFTTLGSDVLYWTFHTIAPYPADAVPPYVFIAGSNINSNEERDVATNLGSITIPFEENDLMDVGTINSTNIYLLDQDFAQVAGTSVSYDYETTTATLTIPALDVCTQHTIHVDNDIQDARGNGVWDLILPATDAEWIFYTLCTTPVVTSVTPANAATDVATDATVTVVFDQPISSPVFYGSNVVISTSIDGSNPISIQDIIMNGDNTGFTITQTEEGLVAGTLYYIVLNEISPANDTSPTYKMATTTYSFTTAGTAPVEEAPAVVVAPVGGGPLITRTTKKTTTTSPTTTTTTPSTTGTTTSSSTPLKDIAGHWAESYIENLYERGIVSGNLDGNYNPDAPITRAEFTKIIVGLYDIPMQDEGSFTSIFKDVNLSKWYAVYVQAAYDDGIIEGYTQNTFSPDKPITRAEAIKVVLEGAGAVVPELDADTTFKDVTKEDWFAKYVKYAVDNGIINGYADGTFGGEKSITRAEVAKIADVMLKNEIITRVMRILR